MFNDWTSHARLRLARAAAACISAAWSEHPFRCHMLEVASLQ
jgi:hypothetical protein